MPSFMQLWIETFNHPARVAALVVIAIAVAGATYALLPRGVTHLNRVLLAISVLLTSVLATPLLVAPLFRSGPDWMWAVAALAGTALVTTTGIHAARTAAGCLLPDVTTRVSWAVAMSATWLALLAVGAQRWAAIAIITFLCAWFAFLCLRSTLTVSPLFLAVVVALPGALTGVAWIGFLLAGSYVASIVASQLVETDERRVTIRQWGLVVTCSLAGLFPLFATSFSLPHVVPAPLIF